MTGTQQRPLGDVRFDTSWLPTSDAARRIAAIDWAAHPLGLPDTWPDTLRTTLATMLSSPESMYLVWGPARIFFFNDAYAPVLGPRIAGAMGACFVELWADAWPDVREPFERAERGTASRFVDLPVAMARHGEREDTWWSFSFTPVRDSRGQVGGVLCLTNETTEHVQRQSALTATESRNRQILDGATDYAIIATDLQGLVVSWNEGARRLFGWSEPEMLGEPIERVVAENDRHAGFLASERERALANGRAENAGWRARKDGSRFWATAETTLLRGGAGEAIGFVKVLRDRTEEHRAQQALAASEASLRRAQEAGGIGVFRVDHDDRIYGTAEFCRIFGLSQCEGVDAQELEALVLPEDRSIASDAGRRASGQLNLAVEYRIRRPSTGEVRWISRRAELEPTEGEGRTRMVGVVQDVTERHLAHRALVESEAKFRAFTEAVPNQVWTALPDGHLDWANGRTYEYTGAVRTIAPDGSEPAIPGNGWSARVHPDDRDGILAEWAQSVATGKRYEVEFRLRRHDGVYRWHLARAVPLTGDGSAVLRWVGTNTDIHDQREARDALLNINTALERRVAEEVRERDRLWSSTNDLMATAGLDGYLKKINPAWQRLLGWDDQTLLGSRFDAFIEAEDHASTAEVIARLGKGETVSGFIDRLRTRDGATRAIMWDAVPEGDLFYAVGRDVTDQLDAEERLRQSQKMEAVGQLTGGIAHDFNNMLTGVIGSMDLLKHHLEQGRTDRVGRYIDAATTSAQRAAGLTQRLLAFSRRQSLDVRPVPTNALVRGMEELLRRTLGENIALDVSLEDAAWSARTDANQLESALLNLAINARDAMPEGGRLTIATANASLSAADVAGVEELEPGDYAVLAVSDTGTGMTADVLASAFDPFFTTKPIGQGTGLGLSMVYGFVRQSGGHVQIRSEPGCGTCVKLFLPRESDAQVAAATDAVPRQSGSGEHVLLVEDDSSVRMLVNDVLADLGYTVTEAADAREALRLLDRIGPVDLLVTDVGLPGMNGRELADAARERRPELKVLFVTGYAEQAAVRGEFLGAGMEMITKPFAINLLSAKIRDMIG